MATETLRPSAPGDETFWTSQEPGTDFHWDKVNEVNADEDATKLYTVTAQQRDLYNLPASSGSGTINKITVYVRRKSANRALSWVYASIKSNSTVTDSPTYYCVDSDTWETFSHEWALNPADDEAWEWADIDSLQIGAKSFVGFENEVSLTQVYVEIDYSPIVERESSVDVGIEATADRQCVYHRYGWR